MEEHTARTVKNPVILSLILVYLYIPFLLVPAVIKSFLLLDFPHTFILEFISSMILWLFITPFILRVPDKRQSFQQYLKNIGLSRVKPFAWNSLLGVIGVIIILSSFFFAGFLPGFWTLDLKLILPPESWTLITSLTPGIWEEVAFRGVILTILLKKYREKTAIILDACLFSFTHLLNLLTGQSLLDTVIQLITTFFLGLVLAFLFIRTGSLLAPILIHYSIVAFGNLFLISLYIPGFGLMDRYILVILSTVVPCLILMVVYDQVLKRWFPRSHAEKT